MQEAQEVFNGFFGMGNPFGSFLRDELTMDLPKGAIVSCNRTVRRRDGTVDQTSLVMDGHGDVHVSCLGPDQMHHSIAAARRCIYQPGESETHYALGTGREHFDYLVPQAGSRVRQTSQSRRDNVALGEHTWQRDHAQDKNRDWMNHPYPQPELASPMIGTARTIRSDTSTGKRRSMLEFA
eukprot:TRINITY_DN5557_c0_g1_i13.p1 TRINITY_DN5557_c0_g1~~TRINITY_DN5557_c0_g1_i13.p1  ORF type:complete len:181 (+),score=15.59 TRINITY_DN5557_c0_g1_i13:539-1081(+)